MTHSVLLMLFNQFLENSKKFLIILKKVTQVIGLTNDDPVSKKHRPAKQIIERLKQTICSNY